MTRLGILIAALASAVLLNGCGTTQLPRPSHDPSRYDGPGCTAGGKSARGNPGTYEVWGQRYTVAPSACGYSEVGLASWYGADFHAQDTSSGEPYDMHALTAAHKTLPIPTNVKVTHLGNQRSVIVRVNDRGPFVEGRIIDLSYAAANQLDLATAGIGKVKVESLDVVHAAAHPNTNADASADDTATGPTFIQVGAFAERHNAERTMAQLHTAGFASAAIYPSSTERRSPPLHAVRLGPVHATTELDALTAALERAGYTTYQRLKQ